MSGYVRSVVIVGQVNKSNHEECFILDIKTFEMRPSRKETKRKRKRKIIPTPPRRSVNLVVQDAGVPNSVRPPSFYFVQTWVNFILV